MTEALRRLAKRALRPLLGRPGGGGPAPEPSWWGLEVTPAGELAHRGRPLGALRGPWGSPLHVVLADRLRRNALEFLSAGGAALRPEVFYSYKTNPVPGVLRLLHGAGLGAEVISEYELWLALRLGVPPGRIVYNGPAKSPASIRQAIASDLLLLNVNHREEIPVVAAAARELGRRPRIGVRVNTSTGWAGQFGVPIAGGEAARAVREARDTGVLEVCALHSHLGGMLREQAQAAAHAREVLAFADHLRAAEGVEIGILDFGGSLATPTVAAVGALDRRRNSAFLVDLPAPDPARTCPIRAFASAIVAEVERHARAGGRPPPRVFLEPGRAVTGDAQVLLATVLTLKEAAGGPRWAILDAGVNLAESMRSEYHHVFPAGRMAEPATEPFRLAGPICSPGDLLRASATLPPLRPGDALAIMDAGAYFVPFATSFSFPQPAIVLLDEGQVRLLRRAETFADQVALDQEG